MSFIPHSALRIPHFDERARFALRVTDTSANLPFGKEMKVMVGGLIGLQGQLVTGAGSGQVDNIHALIQQAQARYGSLEALPYQELVKAITAFQPRRRAPVPPKP